MDPRDLEALRDRLVTKLQALNPRDLEGFAKGWASFIELAHDVDAVITAWVHLRRWTRKGRGK